jgi:predicted double-glycine peptidase
MGTYSLEELIKRWTKHDLTPEQVIGQMLQVLQELKQRVEDLEQRMRPEGIITPTKRRS